MVLDFLTFPRAKLNYWLMVIHAFFLSFATQHIPPERDFFQAAKPACLPKCQKAQLRPTTAPTTRINMSTSCVHMRGSAQIVYCTYYDARIYSNLQKSRDR